jgi:prepilin signal peptidase PulO-like enzyme (type II secretory pathway)
LLEGGKRRCNVATTLTPEEIVEQRIAGGAKRFGYVLAAALNGVGLWIAHQLLDWEWPGFLTAEFDDLLPIVTFSFVVSIVANLVYAWSDRWPIKPLGEMATAAIGFAVALSTYLVFPFDFSAHDTDWSWLARLIVIAVMVATVIAFVVESVELARGPSSDREGPT